MYIIIYFVLVLKINLKFFQSNPNNNNNNENNNNNIFRFSQV